MKHGARHVSIVCACGEKTSTEIRGTTKPDVVKAERACKSAAIRSGWCKYNGRLWCAGCSRATQLATFSAFHGRLRGAA